MESSQSKDGVKQTYRCTTSRDITTGTILLFLAFPIHLGEVGFFSAALENCLKARDDCRALAGLSYLEV